MLTRAQKEEQVVELLCRLRAAPKGRAMVLPERLFPGRAGGHPWRPIQIEQVAQLGPEGQSPLERTEITQNLAAAGLSLFGPEGQAGVDTLSTVLLRAIGRAD